MQHGKILNRRVGWVALSLGGMLAAALAGRGEEGGYRVPPEAVRAVIEAPALPVVRVSPDRRFLVVLHRPGLPGIEELAGPELRLAGLRFHPGNLSPSRETRYDRVEVVEVATGAAREVVGWPAGGKLAEVSFAPDGNRVAAVVVGEERTELWGFEVAGGTARRLTERGLNRVLAGELEWLPDSSGVVAALRPESSGEAPAKPLAPAGPVVQESDGRVAAPARTYQDLLRSDHDEKLFAYYGAAEVARVDWAGGRIQLPGVTGLIGSLAVSPDGNWLLVSRVEQPFSRLVPVWSFGRRVEAVEWGTGRRVEVARLAAAEDVPMGRDATRVGRRLVAWRADAAATLWLVEALDGGDPKAEAEARDRLSVWAAPFRGEPVELARTRGRFDGIVWGGEDCAVLIEDWWKTREERVWRLRPGQPGAEPELLFAYSSQDRYAHPGSFVTAPNAAGRPVLERDAAGSALFLMGEGAAEEGDRPFLDRFDLATGKTVRLFRSEAPYYERPVALARTGEGLLTMRESPVEPPNVWLRQIGVEAAARPVTRFPHPQPGVVGLEKRELRYARADGLPLSATLYLPPGYRVESGRLPGLVWAYPREFVSAGDAGQVQTSPYRFIRVAPTSPLLAALAGYAVIDNASMPIVGAGAGEPNDTFVAQLVMNAEAAIAEGARLGVLDPERVAVAGHSYGAFMTANLLAHSDLFRAGIARSGAYNRTLTPFGFQNEERTFWQAPEIYLRMSPFAHADKINEPVLLIHGEADDNSGTFPLQSERLFQALKGHGGVARLVLLPHESHGYQARESVLEVAAQTLDWLDCYVGERMAPEKP